MISKYSLDGGTQIRLTGVRGPEIFFVFHSLPRLVFITQVPPAAILPRKTASRQSCLPLPGSQPLWYSVLTDYRIIYMLHQWRLKYFSENCAKWLIRWRFVKHCIISWHVQMSFLCIYFISSSWWKQVCKLTKGVTSIIFLTPNQLINLEGVDRRLCHSLKIKLGIISCAATLYTVLSVRCPLSAVRHTFS